MLPNTWSKLPTLTEREERDLAVRAQGGDVAARDKLVESTYWLICQTARAFKGRTVPFDDLCQEGVIALILCIKEYKPELGQFRQHAGFGIRRAMHEAARTNRLVQPSVYASKRVKKYGKAIAEGASAEDLGLTSGAFGLVVRAVAYHEQTGHAFASAVSLDQTPMETEPEVTDLEKEEQSIKIREAVDRLPERERVATRLRYGFDGEPHKLATIGEALGCTPQGAGKILKRAKARILLRMAS